MIRQKVTHRPLKGFSGAALILVIAALVIALSNFFSAMERLGVGAVICTDISKDGAMEGTAMPLYRRLSARFRGKLIASGGVSSLEDVRRLKALGVHGAIIGKALYTGAIDLAQALEVAR